MVRWVWIGIASLTIVFPWVLAQELSTNPSSTARGKKALETRAFTSAGWSLNAYDEVWRHWTPASSEKPENYQQAFMERYGLHPAPYDNGKFPMGIREGKGLLGKGLATDCLLCHGGSIMGKSYMGLGNTSLDIQALFKEMGKASGTGDKLPFTFSNVRGTTEAGGFGVFLLGFRNPDLSIKFSRPEQLGFRDDMCEDVPAWWLLKKKESMYWTGSTPAHSVRSIMQFMLASTWGPEVFAKEEPTFRDIQAFLFSLEAPKYPFEIDEELAAKGKVLFEDNCAKCHGTYGEKWTYPNRVVALDVIGTDPTRFHGIEEKWGHYYNKSWFAKEQSGWFGPEGYKVRATKGYQAPPLDGVWATAPYFHNGSVPTLYHVLNSKARPKIFTRSFKTDENAYDKTNIGWKFTEMSIGASPLLSEIEQRKVYDTRASGRGNQGHTFGDRFTDAQRRAVIEYLKKL